MSDNLVKTEKKRVRRTTKSKEIVSDSINHKKVNPSDNLNVNENVSHVETHIDSYIECKVEKETKKENTSTAKQSNEEEQVELYEDGESNVKVPKKRGRKPKGGKIIKPPTKLNDSEPERPNIILHLKCSLADVEDNIFSSNELKHDPNVMERLNGFSFSNKKLPYEFIKPVELTSNQSSERAYPIPLCESNIVSKMTFENLSNYTNECENENVKDIWKKLSELETSLHLNDISDKKSACFWCTCDFDSPPIFIPKYELNNEKAQEIITGITKYPLVKFQGETIFYQHFFEEIIVF